MSVNPQNIAETRPRKKPIAFISYAREDRPFVEFLKQKLGEREIELKGDWQLQPGVRYQEELHAAIISADTFIFVITPFSLASEPCRLEVEFADKNNKRLAPLVRVDVPDDSIYKALRPIQYTFMRESDDVDSALHQLESGIKTDLQWVKSHSYWLERAVEWEEKNHSRSSLLRGADLQEAERWLTTASADVNKDPRPTPLQTEYLSASRHDEKKRQRITLGAVSTGLLVALILLVFAVLQYRVAKRNEAAALKAQADTAVALEREQKARKDAQDALERETKAKDETQKALTRETEAKRKAVESADAERKARAAEEVARQNAERATKEALQNLSQAYVQKADRALQERDVHGSEMLLATALTLDDRPDTREKLWEATSKGVRLRWTSSYRPGGSALALTNDGSRLALGCNDYNIRLWDTANGSVTQVLRGHTGYILSLAFNPSQKLLASAGRDQTIRIWDIASGNEIRSLTGHDQEVTSVAFSADGNRVFSVGKDGTLRVWSITSGKLVAVVHLAVGPLKYSSFSPDGKWLAYNGGDENQIRIVDIGTGKELSPLQQHQSTIKGIAFSPKGDRLVSQDANDLIVVWEVRGRSFSLLKQRKVENMLSVGFTADGKSLAGYHSYGYDTYLSVWNIESDREEHHFPVDTSLNGIQVSNDGRWIASGGDMIRLFRLDLNQEVFPISGHGHAILDLAYSPDGRLIASTGLDNTVRLWDARSGTTLRIFNFPKCREVIFSPDATVLAANDVGGRVRLWDVESGTELAYLNDGKEHSAWGGSGLSFSPAGDLLYEVVDDETFLSWPIEPRKPPIIPDGVATTGTAYAISPNGNMAAICSEKRIKLLDLVSRSPIIDKEQEDYTKGVAFSADNSLLAVANRSGTIRIWSTDDGKEVNALRTPDVEFHELAFSQDGQRLVAAGYGLFSVWDVETGTEIVKLQISRKNKEWNESVAFSPDGRSIAVGSDDSAIRVWSLENADTLTTLRGHRSYIRNINYSADGNLLLTDGLDKKAQLWDVTDFHNPRLLFTRNDIKAAALNPDGKTLALATSSNTIEISDASGTPLFEFHEEEKSEIRHLTFNDNGRLACMSTIKLDADGIRTESRVSIWDVNGKRKLNSFNVDLRVVEYLAFAPHGVNLLALGGSGLSLWNPETGKEVAPLKGHDGTVTSISFDHDGKRLATSSRDGTVRLWNIEQRQLIKTFYGHTNWVEAVAFSPDDRMIASAGPDRTVRFWDTESGREIYKLPLSAEGGPPNGFWFRKIAFNPKQPVVAVSTGGYSVRLWDLNLLTSFFKTSPKKLVEDSEQHTGLRLTKLEVVQ